MFFRLNLDTECDNDDLDCEVEDLCRVFTQCKLFLVPPGAGLEFIPIYNYPVHVLDKSLTPILSHTRSVDFVIPSKLDDQTRPVKRYVCDMVALHY